MNVILISECTKTAAKFSRRILSKYARNIARRTWIASITKQGLEHLQQELSQIATKNTAVASIPSPKYTILKVRKMSSC